MNFREKGTRMIKKVFREDVGSAGRGSGENAETFKADGMAQGEESVVEEGWRKRGQSVPDTEDLHKKTIGNTH